MAAAVLSDLDGLLKRNYGDDFITQQQFDPDYISTMPKAPEKPEGEAGAIYLGVRMQRRQNGGAQNQGEQFRTNAVGVRKQATVTAKVNIWAFELTNYAIALSSSATAAFFSGLDDEMADSLAAMKKDENRQCFGYGQGVLALVNGAIVNNTVITVDTPGVQYFYPGMIVDFWNGLPTSAGTKEASAQISSISETNGTITLASAVTVTDNDYIVRQGIGDNSPASDGKEMMGMQGCADAGTFLSSFQGLTRSTYPIWNGQATSAGSASITSDLLQRVADKVERISGKVVDTIVSHRNQRRSYLNLLTPLKRFQDDDLDAGFSALEWNGMRWLVSHDCQRDTVYMYPRKSVQLFEVMPIKLDDTDGKILTRIPKTDTAEGYYKHYANIGTRHPASVGALTTLATLTDY